VVKPVTVPGGVDVTTPNVARIYDFLLGGKDNFAVDRAAAAQLLAAIPDVAAIARDGRAFLTRAVRYVARDAGVEQFIDLGAGLPTQLSVHEAALPYAPAARVAYVDSDAVVWSHGQALLAEADRVVMVHADLRDPESILDHPDLQALLDLSRPVAVLCASSLHFVPDEDRPGEILARYRDRLAPGSFLVISHASVVAAEEDPDGDVDSATEVFSQASSNLHARTYDQISELFDGFTLVDPGLVWMPEWRPDPGTRPLGRLRSLRAGVGRKPLLRLGNGFQQVDQVLLIEVAGPAERRGVEPRVADAGIGAQGEQAASQFGVAVHRGHVQRGLPRVIGRRVRPAHRVHVEARGDQQSDRLRLSVGGRPYDEAWPG
jgi:SAM-dependent methyltransferase